MVNSFVDKAAHSLIKYASTKEVTDGLEAGEDGCLISFWSQTPNGKFFCDEVLSVKSVVKRSIN